MSPSTSRTAFLFVNGILTVPGCAANWTRRAVTWIHTRTPHQAEAIEYFSGATLSRRLFQKARANKLIAAIRRHQLAGVRRIIIAGHSNGADVILDALRHLNWPQIEAVHLLSPACDADCDRNGLNHAMAMERIRLLRIYKARKDWALLLANTFTARFLFGYGALGRTGPRFHTFPADLIERDFGHGGWFSEAEFETTMRHILNAGPPGEM